MVDRSERLKDLASAPRVSGLRPCLWSCCQEVEDLVYRRLSVIHHVNNVTYTITYILSYHQLVISIHSLAILQQYDVCISQAYCIDVTFRPSLGPLRSPCKLPETQWFKEIVGAMTKEANASQITVFPWTSGSLSLAETSS